MSTTTYTRERTLQDEIAPAIERSLPDVEVLSVELVSPSRFCVYIDHPAGVDHALCERVTHLLDGYRADYTVDVSSPGPERPLRKPAHFAFAVGRTITVRTEGKVDGRSRFRGEVRRGGRGLRDAGTGRPGRTPNPVRRDRSGEPDRRGVDIT